MFQEKLHCYKEREGKDYGKQQQEGKIDKQAISTKITS